MNYYMLVLRQGDIDFSEYSPEDFQRIIAEFDDWNATMIRKQQLIASGNLKDGEGRTITPGPVIKDGPYSEIHEAVTGFFLIRANDYAAAESIAVRCPFLKRGGTVEVRLMPQLEFEDAALSIVEQQIRARSENAKAEA
ncbi:MAG: hypothetical protein H7A21_14610 [Spirochaetales bacterium]|nr:hypothetical protein [Leptospiraceae bacterium]MCP5482665.1 hypothetical protein [Spirochaetales bacterium]MCP5485047.1 hypothetical protein [Spirochaetales bacterium]